MKSLVQNLFLTTLILFFTIPFVAASSAPSGLYDCGINPAFQSTASQCFANNVAYNDDTTWCSGALGSPLENNDAAAVGANCDSIPNSQGKTGCARQETDQPYCKDGTGILVLDMGIGQEIVNSHDDWDLIVGEGGAGEPYSVSVSNDGVHWVNLGNFCASSTVNIPGKNLEKYRYVQINSKGKLTTCDGQTVTPPQNYGADIDYVMARTIPCSGTLCTSQVPTCSLGFNPSSINQGSSTTISLSTSNAKSVKVSCTGDLGNDQSSSIPLGFSDSEVVKPMQSQSCTATVYAEENYKGTAKTCSTAVEVKQTTPTPVCSFAFNPDHITPGATTNASLATQNAKSVKVVCTGDLGSVQTPSVPLGYADSELVKPTRSQSCTATVYAKENYQGASATCDDAVMVQAPPEHTPTCTSSFNPSSINQGATTNISVGTHDARSIKVACTGDLGSAESPSIPLDYTDSELVTPGQSQSCTTTVYAKENYQGASATCKAEVLVKPTPTTPSCGFDFNPDHIIQGATTNASLATQNAKSVKVVCTGDLGSVQTPSVPLGYADSELVKPTRSQSCTATVYAKENYQGASATCDDAVMVQAPPEHTPTCDFAFNPTHIELGDDANFTLATHQAQSFKVVCITPGGTPTFYRDIPYISEGFVYSDTYGIERSQTCSITVYTEPNYQGTTGTCEGSITVTQPQKDLSIAVDDVHILQDSGLHVDLRDLLLATHAVNIDPSHLTFNLVSESNTAVVDCELDNLHYITCETQSGQSGMSTLHVSVSGDGLSAEDDFIVYVDPVEHQHIQIIIPDQTVDEDAGILNDFLNLRDLTTYSGSNHLTYEVVEQSNPEIIECHVDHHFLDCETKADQSGMTTITIRVTDGDLSDTDTFVITVTPEDDAPNATFTQGSICQGHATILNVDINDGSVQEVKWDFGDGSEPAFGTSVKHTYAKSGSYNVKITIRGNDPNDVTILNEKVKVNGCSVVKHQISIQSAYIDSGIGEDYDVFQAGDTIDLYVKVKNLGNRNEDVVVSAALPEVGLEERVPSVMIKAGEAKWRLITIVLPEDITPGEHVVRLTADGDRIGEARYVAFTVE